MEKGGAVRWEISLCRAILVEMVVACVENGVPECEDCRDVERGGQDGELRDKENHKKILFLHFLSLGS